MSDLESAEQVHEETTEQPAPAEEDEVHNGLEDEEDEKREAQMFNECFEMLEQLKNKFIMVKASDAVRALAKTEDILHAKSETALC